MIRKMRKVFFNYMPILSKAWIAHAIPPLYRILEIGPSSAVIMITDRCNLRCIMCKQWRKSPGRELSTENWKKIIRDLKKNGIKNIHFTGGEPLLRRDLIELVSYASENGFVVGMTTNGGLLEAEGLKDLVNAGLRSMAISMDATGEAYEAIRGVNGSFRKVKDALAAVSEIRKKSRIDTYINFTLMNGNMEDLKRVKGVADDAGLAIHVCLLDKNSSIFNVEDNKKNFCVDPSFDKKSLNALTDFLMTEKIKRPKSLLNNLSSIGFINKYFNEPRQKNIPCIVSQDRIFIDPYGNLLGGCLSMGILGNIKENDLSKLLRDVRYRKAKKNMFYKNCPGCSCGYVFNLRHHLPSVIKDAAYHLRYLFGSKYA